MGYYVWFGNGTGSHVVHSGTVVNNTFIGAFGYAMAMSGVTNFTVENNVLVGNTSFIGDPGPNCDLRTFAPPAAFVIDPNGVRDSTVKPPFKVIPDGNYLIGIRAPNPNSDSWPFVVPPPGSTPTVRPRALSTIITTPHANFSSVGLLPARIIPGLLVVGVLAWFTWNRVLRSAKIVLRSDGEI
jgi:hypothetical protein